MKITTRQLKQIIREEVKNVKRNTMNESDYDNYRDEAMLEYTEAIEEFLTELIDSGDEPFDDESYEEFVESAIVDFFGSYEGDIERWQDAIGLSREDIEQEVRGGIEMVLEREPSAESNSHGTRP